MTIKSDKIKVKKPKNELDYDNTFASWWKYSQDKGMAFASLGAFWDFRNEKSHPVYEKDVANVLELYANEIDKVSLDRGGHYLVHRDYHEKFWVANKYYAWRMENGKIHRQMNLTIRQISKLDKILRKVEKRDCSHSA